ncbi:MAG: tyrosine-protein phosphatase [Bdellovibrionaceae bacterium]|nr:tyrosine-protein phosphatase [Pseudobdellovibrionaceae bacterium]
MAFKSILFQLLLCFVVSFSVTAQSVYVQSYGDAVNDVGPQGPVTNGIPNFQKTTDAIYRGGRPSEQGLLYLKKAGFKTIINLENNEPAVAKELAFTKKIGINMYSAPMSHLITPNEAQVNSILKALSDPKMYPVFVHCHYGKDRTGMIVGLYRVLMQGWKPQDAYREMLSYGFHPEYKALDNYFRVRTQMRR